MVLYTGAWNNQHRPWDDTEDDEGDYNHTKLNDSTTSLSRKLSPIAEHVEVGTTTTGYGSISSHKHHSKTPSFGFENFFSQLQSTMGNSHNKDDNNESLLEGSKQPSPPPKGHHRKTISWGDDVEGIGQIMMTQEKEKQDENISDATSISSDSGQELPSLTAAFQSIENRPIFINCMWYLVTYFGIAIAAYSFIFEQWTIIDSLYFAVSTFTTCGYGDLEPESEAGKLFTILFAIYGVIILGVFIAIFGSFISETQNKAMRKFKRKKQSQMLDALFHSNNTEHETDKRRLEEGGFWIDHISFAEDVWCIIQNEWMALGLVAGLGLILGIRENWGFTNTLYFAIMAATTTGYGDYSPSNQADKLYSIFFLPLAVAVFGEVLGRIATVYIQRKQRIAEQKFLHRSLTMCDIRKMDTNEDGAVDREDFITFMLVALQKVDRTTINELREIFDSLDKNGNGLLEADDFNEWAEESYMPALEQVKEEVKLDMNSMLSSDQLSQLVSARERLSCKPKHKRHHTVT